MENAASTPAIDLDFILQFIMQLRSDPLALSGIGIVFLVLTVLCITWILKRRTTRKSPLPVTPDQEISHEIPEQEPAENWLTRLHASLEKTRKQFSSSLAELFDGSPFDEDLLERIHEILFKADIGVKTCDKLIAAIESELQNKNPTWEQVKPILEAKLVEILTLPESTPPSENDQEVYLVVGVNGVGKTTTIAKLANNFKAQGKKVMLCAADTFRAAAIEQLAVWSNKLNVDIIKHNQGSDPAAVAFDAVKAAKSRNADTLIIDTAGRLHNKKELMAELEKIKKVTKRELDEKQLQTWLVIDATTGQNARQQVDTFNQLISLDGLVVTKLDGTAKGGAIVGICDECKIPIKYIGIGEKIDDLKPFSASDFVHSILN